MPHLRPFEFFLVQSVFYLLLWLVNDYMGSLVSLTFGSIILAIFIISLIVEWIQPSKVPRSYFYYMLASIAAPILIGIIYLSLMGGQLDWFE